MTDGTSGGGPTGPSLADAQHLGLRLETVSSSARQARDFVRSTLDDLDDETLQTVLLVSTELVTNAVLHGQGPIDLTVEVNTDAVLVRVVDREPREPELREPTVDQTDGRGIALVAMVSRRWGTESYAGGKSVWAIIDRAA